MAIGTGDDSLSIADIILEHFDGVTHELDIPERISMTPRPVEL